MELQRKLRSRAFDSEGVDRVLAGLAQQRLQSDERFAEQYVHSRRQRGFGPLRIHAELRERGVDEDLIAIFLDERDEIWDQNLQEVYRKKYGGKLPADKKEQARRSRFLAYRGFSGEQIQRFFRADAAGDP